MVCNYLRGCLIHRIQYSMPAVGGEGGHNASMTDVILDKKKILLAHYVSQVQQIQSSPNTTKVEMHLSRILKLINVCEGRRELQAFYWLYLSYTLILIPLFWSHLRMSWNSTFRSNVIRRESLTDSQPLLHRQTSDLHKELPLWLISLINIHNHNSLSRCRRYTGVIMHLYVAC